MKTYQAYCIYGNKPEQTVIFKSESDDTEILWAEARTAMFQTWGHRDVSGWTVINKDLHALIKNTEE